MAQASAHEPPKRGMTRTITGSHMDLSEMESLISGASLRGQETETSSIASSSQTGRSNIIQIVPGKKNIKAALRAALAEAQGYDDPDEPPVLPLEDMQLSDDNDSVYDFSSPSSPSKRPSLDLKHDSLKEHASEPLYGAGTASRGYRESSAPPEGAGGFSIGEFVPPVVTEQKPPSRRRLEAVGNGLHRTVTGSSLKLSELNDLVERAGEQECPKTPSSQGGRTPRSNSGLSLASGSRSSSIIQIQPGVKDIRTALANAIADGQESFGGSARSPSETNLSESQGLGSLNDRLGLGGSFQGGTTTPGGTSLSGSNPFYGQGGPPIQRNSRSIRRLMSEKSFTMDTVYSGMVMEGDLPSEPLEGTGLVSGRKYVEPKHGPQYTSDAPRDFPRVVNGVPTTGGGDSFDAEQRMAVPPSPNAPLRKTGVHRTISGSQMDLSELAAIMEKATVPKSERNSFDCSRSSTGGASTHRTIRGSGIRSSGGSQVFGEELDDEPKSTFGHRACSISEQEIQDLINKASVPRSEPDSPRSLSSQTKQWE